MGKQTNTNPIKPVYIAYKKAELQLKKAKYRPFSCATTFSAVRTSHSFTPRSLVPGTVEARNSVPLKESRTLGRSWKWFHDVSYVFHS